MNGFNASAEEMCKEYLNGGKKIGTYYQPAKGHVIVAEYTGFFSERNTVPPTKCEEFHDHVRGILGGMTDKVPKTKVETIKRHLASEFDWSDYGDIQLYCQVTAEESKK